MENHLTLNCWFLCLTGLLANCAGCWEEVHYDPNKPTAVTSVVNDPDGEVTDPAAGESPSEVVASDDESSETAEVTADELFGEAQEPTEPVDAAAPAVESADAPDQESADPSDLESDGPLTTEAPDADAGAEQPAIPENEDPDDEAEATAPEETATVEPSDSNTVEVMRPSRTALAVWRMSSRWSFAAAVYAKGQPEERYRDSLEQAAYAADLVGVELPAFPASEGMALETAVISYLLDAGPAAFVNKLSEDYVPESEALAELAIRTHALLLVYTPKSQQLEPLISSIRQSAENSGLPAELWTDLVSMLERREPFADVKQRVLAFHAEVGDYLAGEQ
jgi:hypothetical protein